ncbi:hypothetical protein D3C73_1185610 [compost metagenome]
MVITFPITELLIIGINIFSDSLGRSKIERSSFHRYQLASRYQCTVNGRILIGKQLKLMVQYCTTPLTIQIKISVIC